MLERYGTSSGAASPDRGRTVTRLPSWRVDMGPGQEAVRRSALPGLRGAHGQGAARRPASQARRRDARRQPAVGQGGRSRHRPRPPRRRREHRAAARLVRGGRRRGRHAVAALHRQPQPQPPRSSSRCSRSSRRRCSRSRSSGAGGCTRWGRSTSCRRRRPRPSSRRPTSTRDVDGLLVNIAVGYGGRREIADAVRSLLDEHAEKGTSLEELARGPRRRAHRRPPLHQGPARSRPGDPHLRRAAARRLPALAERQVEFYFCEAYWPDFRRVDFLRAIRAYAQRERRFGA